MKKREIITELTLEGLSSVTVAARAGCSPQWVQKVKAKLRDEGVLPDLRAPARERILSLCLEGLTTQQVAQHLEVTVKYVQDIKAELRRRGELPAYERRADNLEIQALAAEGLKASIIADRVGLKVGAVRKRISRLISEGKLPRAANRNGRASSGLHSYGQVYYRYGATFGRISYLLESLPPKQAEWLLAQVPEGGKVIDVLRGIVTDAYFEENGDE